MSTDVLPETRGRLGTPSQPQPQVSQQPDHRHNSSQGRWWKRSLLAAVLIAVVMSAAALIPGVISSQETGPRLTHTIRRGNLVVSVTEQGTLESSNNTEIKCKVRGSSTVTWVIPGGTVVKPGDELVRLDTKRVEEALSLTKTNFHIATATLERTRANVARAEIAIDAYLKGRYRSQLKLLEKDLVIAKSNLQTAQNMLNQTELLFKRGYVNELEVEGNQFTVTQADLELKVVQTEIDVLKRFTRKMTLEMLNGNLIAGNSKLEADIAGLVLETKRRTRAANDLAACVITAKRGGLVIYPSAAAWKNTPDITQGATVRKDQVLLLMPDLSSMQVKVGIHESMIDRIKPGMTARVTLPDRTLKAQVSTVASVTRPAGWWTGNVVKYDTIIELPSEQGLKPGMSAEIELIMAVHEDVLTIPVAAVVEIGKGEFCWVKTAEGAQRRSLQLGDSNDVFIVVEAGLKEGDEVVLNPLAYVEESQTQAEALKTLDETKQREQDSPESGTESSPPVTLETDHGN